MNSCPYAFINRRVLNPLILFGPFVGGKYCKAPIVLSVACANASAHAAIRQLRPYHSAEARPAKAEEAVDAPFSWLLAARRKQAYSR